MSQDVCVGGSFNILHAGHLALLGAAVREADGGTVFVGITSDQLSDKGYPRPLFEIRSQCVISVLQDFGCQYHVITQIDSAYPPALTGEIDGMRTITAIIVSQETAQRAMRLNDMREKNGLPPLRIVTVPLLMSGLGKPIAARLIAAGIMDKDSRAVDEVR